MKVLVLGGTGAAGRSTVGALLTEGHEVSVHARSAEKAARLEAAGARPWLGGTDDRVELRRGLVGKDAVVDLRVAIPSYARAVLPGAWREYRRLRDRAVADLVDAAVAAGTPRLVHDSVTFVYADGGDDLLDEDAGLSARGAIAANLACERHVARFTEVGGDGVALRYGFFYGPDDWMSQSTLRLASRGLALLFGADEAWHSAIHTDDVGPAVASALRAPGGVYNVVDDEPLRRGELASVLAGAVGRSRLWRPPTWLAGLGPATVRSQARSQRVSAARFTQLTDWRPTVTTRRTGWAAVARQLTGSDLTHDRIHGADHARND